MPNIEDLNDWLRCTECKSLHTTMSVVVHDGDVAMEFSCDRCGHTAEVTSR